MLIFKLNENMKFFILHIKPLRGNCPSVTCITEKILMEIAYSI